MNKIFKIWKSHSVKCHIHNFLPEWYVLSVIWNDHPIQDERRRVFLGQPISPHLLRISLDFLSHLFLVVLCILTPCCLPQTKSQTWIVQSNNQSLKTVPISNECDVCSDKDQIISRLLCLKKKINIHEKVVLQLYSFILVQSSVCPCLYLYIYILDFRLSHQHACELFLLSVFKN